MSRRPKFKVWDKHENKWFNPVYEAYKGNLMDLSITLSGELLMRTMQEPAIHESTFKDRFELVQSTGLKDENKVEIFEGDIVHFRADYTNKKSGWMDGRIVLGVYQLEIHCGDIIYSADEETDEFPYTAKVIGNIYENPTRL